MERLSLLFGISLLALIHCDQFCTTCIVQEESEYKSNNGFLINAFENGENKLLDNQIYGIFSIIFQENLCIPILFTNNCSLLIEKLLLNYRDGLLLDSRKESKLILNRVSILGENDFTTCIIKSDCYLKLDDVILTTRLQTNKIIRNIVSSEENTYIDIEKINFKNFLHFIQGTMFDDGCIGYVDISDSRFENITWNEKYQKKIKDKNKKCCSCLFLKTRNNKFLKCQNSYYGCITHPSSLSSLTLNCSFIQCFTETITERKEYTSGNHSFSDIIFEVNGDDHGGALCFEGSASAYIDKCIFNKCNNTRIKDLWNDDVNIYCRGGAVWSECGEFVCSNTNCTECDAYEGDSFFSLWNGTKRVLDHCLFSVASSFRYGGANIEKGPSGTVVHRCIFENGTSGTYGGGAGLMISYVRNELTVSECTFQHNYAGYHAGALHFFLQDSNVGSDILCIYLKFNNNTSNKSQGSDVLFNMQFEKKHFSTDKFIMCVSNSGEHRFGHCTNYDYDSTECLSYVDYDDYLPSYPGNKLYVDGSDSASIDEWHCGDNDDSDKPFKCKTLDFALTQWHPLFQDKIYVENDEGTEPSCLNVSFRNVEVDMTSLPSDESGRVILRLKDSRVSEGSLINMSTGTFRMKGNFALNNFKLLIGKDDDNNIPNHLSSLDTAGSILSITNCTITTKFDAVTKSFTTSVLFVDKGLLNLNNDNFEEINMDGVSLLSFSLGSDCEYSFTSVLFKNIVRNSGNGAVIEQTISNDQTFELSGVTFDGCQSPNGNGGVIYVEIGGNGKVVIGKEGITTEFKYCSAVRGGMIYIKSTSESVTVEISNITFDKKDTSSHEIHGEYIFVEAGTDVNISSFVKKEDFPIIFYDDVDFNDTAGIKEGLDIPVPLKLLFFTFPEYPVVDMESITIADYCGYEEYPCNFLFSAFDKLSVGTKKACIRNKYIVSESILFDSENGFEINGKDNSNITAEGGCYFDVTVNTAFNSIPVCIPDSLTGHDSLFSVSANKLTMNIVEFEIISSWRGYTLWKVSGEGSINLTSVSFEPTNIINGGQSLLLFDESGSGGIDISGCNISNISKISGNGCVINANLEEGSVINVINSNFIACECVNGKGGAIYINSHSADTQISFNNVTFRSTELFNNNNNNLDDEEKNDLQAIGHCIFLYVNSLEEFYQHNKEFIDNYPFNENDRNDIVGVSSYNDSYNIWLGYFIVGVSGELEVEEKGLDLEGCGSELFPCKTLEKGFERQNENKKVFIKSNIVIEKDILFIDYSYLINGKEKNGNMKRKNSVKYIEINVNIKGDYESVFNSKGNVTFNYLTFPLPLSLNGRGSLFEHSQADSSSSTTTLTLSNCVFEKKNEEGMMKNEEKESNIINYELVRVISGNININNISIIDLKFTSNSVIVVQDTVKLIDINYIDLNNDEFYNGLFELRIKENEERNININNLNINRIILNNNPLFIYNNTSSSLFLSKERRRNEVTSKLSLTRCNFNNIQKNGEGESNIIFSSSTSLSPSVDMNECSFSNITLIPDRNTGSVLIISSYSSNMTNCSFNGKEEEEQKEEQKEEEICLWNGSIIEVSKGIAIFDGCTMANSSKGGINIKEGSNVTLKGCIFNNNNPKYIKYGNVRRNVICSSSRLKGEEMKEEENDSLWILNNKCTFEGLDQYSSLLFIPSISDVSYIDEPNDNNTVNVTFEGNLLLPCNLSLKVIESDEENLSINYFLYSFSSFENDNKAYAFISYPFLFTSDSSHSLSVSLLYSDGREGKTVESEPFIFREGKNNDDEGGGTDKDKDKDKDKSSSVIWIIIGSVLGFVFIVIIIVIIIVLVVCKKRSIPEGEEKKEEELIEGTEVKEEMAIKPWNEEDEAQFNSSTEQSSEMTMNKLYEKEEN